MKNLIVSTGSIFITAVILLGQSPTLAKAESIVGTNLRSAPDDGYRAVAEFEPSAAFLVSDGEWGFGDMLREMIREGTAADGAPVIVVTGSGVSSCESSLQSWGIGPDRGRCIAQSTGRKWIRDYGPIGIYEAQGKGHLAVVDAQYYGINFPAADAVPEILADDLGISRYGLQGGSDEYKFIFEGGNYITDGKGTCIMSDDVWLDNANNPDADTREEVETICRKYLGCQRFYWLVTPPQAGGSTTGHVNIGAKLVTPLDIIIMQGGGGGWEEVFDQNAETMATAKNVQGETFRVHRVQMSGTQTYAQALILNQVVLVPVYGILSDQDAIDAYQQIMGPSYRIVGISATAIASQGGTVADTTVQLASACGNGRIDFGLFEQCEEGDLNGEDCESLGLGAGFLSCTDDFCRYDTSGCSGDTDTDGDTDSGGDGDADADGDADGDTDTDGDSDADSDGDTDGDTDTDGDSDADSDGDTDSDGDADGDMDTDGDGDTDTDVDTDSDSDADLDSDSSTEEDSDTDTSGCDEGLTQCLNDLLQYCTNQVWHTVLDCAAQGQDCDVVNGQAQCAGDEENDIPHLDSEDLDSDDSCGCFIPGKSKNRSIWAMLLSD